MIATAHNVKVKLDLPKADDVIKNCGLDPGGEIQMAWAQIVLNSMSEFMPLKSGAFIKKTVINSDGTKITTVGDESAYLFYGNLMVDDITGSAWSPKYGTKHVVIPHVLLDYNKEKNPQAGPRWDLAVKANKGDKMAADLQAIVDKKKGGG